jgi:hypothetical protein
VQFLLDTNAIIRHFAQVSRLGSRAKDIITQAEKDQHQLDRVKFVLKERTRSFDTLLNGFFFWRHFLFSIKTDLRFFTRCGI